MIWACLPVVHHEKCSRVKFEAICLTATAWPKLGRAKEQLPQTQHQTYNRKSENEKDQGVAVIHLKSRCQPD